MPSRTLCVIRQTVANYQWRWSRASGQALRWLLRADTLDLPAEFLPQRVAAAWEPSPGRRTCRFRPARAAAPWRRIFPSSLTASGHARALLQSKAAGPPRRGTRGLLGEAAQPED